MNHRWIIESSSHSDMSISRNVSQQQSQLFKSSLGRNNSFAFLEETIPGSSRVRSPSHSSSKNSLLYSTTMKKACNMLCGKGRVRTQDLGYQVERCDHCATRPVVISVHFPRRKPSSPTSASYICRQPEYLERNSFNLKTGPLPPPPYTHTWWFNPLSLPLNELCHSP